MKEILKAMLAAAGVEVRRKLRQPGPGTSHRPVGDLVAFMQDLRARGFAPASIVDIGANRGAWCTAVASVFPSSCYFLFEPVSEFDAALATFVRGHPGSKCWRAAVGSEVGTVQMDMIFTQDGKATTGSTVQPARHDSAYRVEKTSVRLVTLDSMLASREIPSTPEIVKIDVEGYEKDVLAGATQVLGRTEVLILECSLYRFWGKNMLFRETLSLLAEAGYELYDFAGFNRRPRDGALGQTDAVFVLRDSPLRRESPWDE